MPRLPRTRVLAALASLTLLVPLGLVAGGASAPAAAELSRDAGYTCQYTGLESSVVPDELGLPGVGGLPVPVVPSLGGSDEVSVAVQVDAPAKVAPGGTLKLTGTASFTFGANATATNLSTAFTFLSDDFGINVTTGGQKRLVRITKLTTTTSKTASPEVEAEFTLPDVLVPTTATGPITLSLPDEAMVTNPVSTSPESVAFTGVLRTDSVLQPNRDVACALGEGQKTALGSVAVSGPVVEQPTTGEEGGGTVPPAVDPPQTAPVGGGLPGSAPPAVATPPAVGSPATAPPGQAPQGEQIQAALASEPIPPATVPSGFRLPPWALLLVGALLAGGLVAAVGSHRRLRQATVVAAALALLLVVPSPLNRTAPAEAASGQAQVTLICVYQAEGSPEDARARDQPTGVSITLQVPDSVAPGDVVTLTGSATVQAPEDIRSQAAALGYNKLDVISDAFSVGLTFGSGPRQVFLADRIQTGKTAFSNPLVVTGPLSFPAFKVPENASGAVKIELPRNEVVDRRPKPYRNANTPPQVAMEFFASATGNGTQANYIVSCWRSDKGDGLIASIPVKKAGTAPAAPTTQGSTGAPQPGTPQQTTAPGQPVAPGQTPTAGAAVDPSAAPTAGQPAPGAVPSAVAGATAAPQLQGASPTGAIAPASNDAVVPLWLVVLAVLVGLGGYGYAGWNQLRLRSVRSRSS